MEIKRIIVGEFWVNSYILIESSDGILIDPGAEPQKIIAEIKNIKIKYIINTHGHIDHVGANAELKNFTNAPVYIHYNDAVLLKDKFLNGAELFQIPYTISEPDKLLTDNEIINLNDLEIKVIHSPGHTEGSILLSLNNILFSGDTLFKHSVGRTDLPYGDEKKLFDSIKTKILTLPNNTIIYPGHGDPTTLKEEKLHNPFLAF